ncbi:MAG: RIP metalloprotease RseP [Bacteroidales bacterium]|nr:RIP metalloprotease RseP [Bacteroidales bacterium]
MTVLIKILQFILSLSLIVIIHEMGHYFFARLFKTRVEKFYLFFDAWFSLFKFKKGETEYGIGWIPLGGYVKISGMIDESMDKDQMKQPPKPYEFRSKPSWQRLLIMLGGVSFNFILAIVLYIIVLFSWGETYLPAENVKYGIVTDSIGHEMGLKDGDKILAVDGQRIERFNQIIPDIILNERQQMTVERDGEKVRIDIDKKFIPYIIKGQGMIAPREPFPPLEVDAFQRVSPAKQAGLQRGDKVVGIDGKEFDFYHEYAMYISEKAGDEVTVNLLRQGDSLNIDLTLTNEGMMGIKLKPFDRALEYETIKYGFFESIPAGIAKGFKSLGDYLKQFRLIFSKGTKAHESLGGFITIGSIFPSVWNWQAFWELTAFLSVILAIMNILPIPALDGGHVMFLLYEVVTGRKPSDKFMEYAQITGMIILLALLIYANGNDIIRLLNK